MKTSSSAVLAAAAVLLAGCTDPSGPVAAEPVLAAPSWVSSVLANAAEPVGLEVPTFAAPVDVAAVPGQVGRAVFTAFGEPSVWSHVDGTVYLTAPGCDKDAPAFGLLAGPDDGCTNAPVWRSDDAGSSWERLNPLANGSLAEEGPQANGDADVAVDAAGTVYATNLGGGVQVWSSEDRGASWNHTANVVPPGDWSDRQWIAAAEPGHVVLAWMGGAEGSDRRVGLNVTFDGGGNWTFAYVGENIGWLGPAAFDVSGTRVYVPFTESTLEPNGVSSLLDIAGAATFTLNVARSLDGGRTWDVVDTGVRITRTATGLQWSGVLMAPALDVTGDGHVVLAWSEEVADPTGTTATGARLRFVASGDDGATWSQPVDVSARTAAIMPWVVGGAGDRAAITYYASDLPGDSDYVGRWDVAAAVVDGVGASAPQILETVVERDTHVGGICSVGGLCFLTGRDRALLDFFESDLLPDGRLIVTYPVDPPGDLAAMTLRVAVQDGGTPLLLRP